MGLHKLGGITLHTEYVFPSIPVRQFDWSCTHEFDAYAIMGWGKTEEEAIADWLDNYKHRFNL